MAELDQISVVGGIPSSGTGEVPTLAPVRDVMIEVRDKLIASPATQATLASVLAKIISAPATEAKQDALIAVLATVGTRVYGTALTRLAYTGTSAQSAAITGTEVLLHNRGAGACYVKAGSNPTATVNDIPLEPGEKFHLRITSGHKVAAIQDSAGGNLNIIPVA